MVKRNILRLFSRLGQGQRLLDLYTEVHPDRYGLEVDDAIAEYDLGEDEKRGSVLLPLTEGGSTLMTYIFAVLAHAFRTRGYEPVIVLCYDDLPLCLRKQPEPDDVSTCETCYHAGTRYLDEFGLEYWTVSELLPEGYTEPDVSDPENRPLEHGEINVGEYVEATTRKYLKKHIVDLSNDRERNTYCRLASAGLKLAEAAEQALDAKSFDAVVAQSPAYIYGGVFLEVADARDVPAVSVGRGWADQRLLFGNVRNRCSLPQFEDHSFVDTQLSEPLTDEQRTAVHEIMSRRHDGSEMMIDYVGDADDSIGTDDDETTVGLFTNLMWDGSLEADNIVFSNPYAWIVATIEYLADRPDTRLVIKTHPAESILGTDLGVTAYLDDNYNSLPENVDLIPPETEINPYELLEDLDCVAVWNSTVGMEAAYYGLPVIVAGETHYRDLGFTLDPTDPDEYFGFLASLDSLSLSERQRDLAVRYLYYLFIRKSIPYPYFTNSGDGLGGTSVPVTHREIVDDPILDFVVERIIENESVVLPERLVDHDDRT